ncbi:MAG: type II toxin-antitoxin system RelE family toxin [bacterium]
MHNAEWTENALEDLGRLDKPVAKRILNKISWFSEHFDNIIPQSLSGDLAGVYKFRIGDWRVIYTIEEESIVIQAVGHRREIYNR